MGGGEIAIIMVVILLLFGGKKLPELARGLGRGIRDFKDASEGVKREIHRNINSVTMDEEEKKEELNHSSYHHPTEDQQTQTTAEAENNTPITEEKSPEKGKESHIE
ncbi:MAG: twin-arginine translocase TatA/TatE family subunit [Pedobacter sp.]|nr:MAG: twin-arginine translocase TatA/TatE family subunit [Pedobacter sp.]